MKTLFKQAETDAVRVDTTGAEGVVEAWFAIHSNVDLQGDRGTPGMFKTTLAEWQASGKSIPVCSAHNWDPVEGVIGYADPKDVVETSKGLFAKVHLFIHESDEAAYVWMLAKKGLLQCSYAFSTVRESGRGKGRNGANDLYEVELLELTLCLFGANPETEVVSVKADGLVRCVICGTYGEGRNPASACGKCGSVIAPSHNDLTPRQEKAIAAIEQQMELVAMERFAKPL